MNAQTPGPLMCSRHGRAIYTGQPPHLATIAELPPLKGRSRLDDPAHTDPTARLLAASYTMADRAGRELGVDAADLCGALDLAALIREAQRAVEVLEDRGQWVAAGALRRALPAVPGIAATEARP